MKLIAHTYHSHIPDLMQGYSPSEAFASLSPSMRMLDEDIPAIIPITAVEVDDSELWSLDREQVWNENCLFIVIRKLCLQLQVLL